MSEAFDDTDRLSWCFARLKESGLNDDYTIDQWREPIDAAIKREREG